MDSRKQLLLIGVFNSLGFILLLLTPFSVQAQTVVATVPTGLGARAVAVNAVTNKVYVAAATVAVIDGGTNTATTFSAGFTPISVAVNSTTNKIYVANIGETKGFGFYTNGSITIIEGNSGSTSTISDAKAPWAVAVNETTNKIYVLHHQTIDIWVIDGDTNSVTTISDPNAVNLFPSALAVNPITNKIYVANNHGPSQSSPGNITVIEGATKTTTTVTDPNAILPMAVAVNPATNKIYVVNEGNYPGVNHGNITIIDGSTNSITTLTDPDAIAPQAIAVNPGTNKIYVASANVFSLPWNWNGGFSIIDGKTNAVSTVRDPNAIAPTAVAVDALANMIYVANQGCFPPADSCFAYQGSITVINGATNSVTTIIDPKASHPGAVAVNPATNRIYVANGGGNVTVIDGGANATSHLLVVALAGGGTGTVTSNPPGVDCGTSCTASFPTGAAVVLTASPASGSELIDWSGACAGSNPCNVMMTSDAFATATFSNAGPPDFSVTPVSSVLNISLGGQNTDVITIAPQNGLFGNAVQLSCSVTGSTPLATCSLSPPSVTLGANPAIATLTVNAPAQSAKRMPANDGQFAGGSYAIFLPLPGLSVIGLGLLRQKPKHRTPHICLLCAFILCADALLVGCGGGSSTSPEPRALNYTVTVTATAGAIQHTTQVNVTVP